MTGSLSPAYLAVQSINIGSQMIYGSAQTIEFKKK